MDDDVTTRRANRSAATSRPRPLRKYIIFKRARRTNRFMPASVFIARRRNCNRNCYISARGDILRPSFMHAHTPAVGGIRALNRSTGKPGHDTTAMKIRSSDAEYENTEREGERERQLEAIHPSDVDAVSRDGLSTRRHQGVECVTSDGERWPAVDHIRLMGVRLRSPAEPLSSSIDDVTGVLLRRSSGPPTRQNGPTNVSATQPHHNLLHMSYRN